MDKDIFDLSGQVALITGGGHGLGREFCIAMAEYGADVAVSDINMDGALETVELTKGFGHAAVSIQADVSKPADVERMVNETKKKLGAIDILFCTPAIGNPPARIHDLSIKDWDEVMAVNLRGVFLCMRAVLPTMLEQNGGSIIVTASVAGLGAGSEEWGFENVSAYGVSKAAVIMLTRHAATAYAKHGIRINAIAPGGHETWPIGVPKDVLEKANRHLSRFIPMGRMGQPTEIKGLAVFLASDASSYITGQVITQDGGFTA